MLTELDIYDFEGIIEGGIQKVFDDLDTTSFIPANVSEEFQRDLPRCETRVDIGRSGERLLGQVGVESTPGASRELDFFGRLTIATITYPDYEIHRAYRARIRNVCSTLKRRVNGVTLLNHKLQSVKTSGANYFYEKEKLYRTDIISEIKFSVSPQAMAAFDSGEDFPEPAIPALQSLRAQQSPAGQVYYGEDADPTGIVTPLDQTKAALYYALGDGVFYVWAWIPVQNFWKPFIQ